jgi:hypothetical protein
MEKKIRDETGGDTHCNKDIFLGPQLPHLGNDRHAHGFAPIDKRICRLPRFLQLVDVLAMALDCAEDGRIRGQTVEVLRSGPLPLLLAGRLVQKVECNLAGARRRPDDVIVRGERLVGRAGWRYRQVRGGGFVSPARARIKRWDEGGELSLENDVFIPRQFPHTRRPHILPVVHHGAEQ